jgi:hypothetical protein
MASIKSTFGKSTFLVTPKEHQKLSKKGAIWNNRGEIAFGISILVVAFIFNHTIFSTIIIAIPALASVYLSRMANSE